jgi:hypothetical protein
MKIHTIQVSKAELDKIPKMERAFYVHVGHIRHELMVLKKLLEISAQETSKSAVLQDVGLSQQFIISRLLAGKIWEGWQLMSKAYFATKLSHTIGQDLPEDTKEALANLKKYFSAKNNIIKRMRNEFAFHYDPLSVRAQMSRVEETDILKIYVADTTDVFFQLSEIIVGSAMLEAVQPGDFVDAAEKFFHEVMKLSGQLVDFCDGCLHHMIETYIGYQPDQTEVLELPKCKDLRLPFFCK